MGRPPPTVPRRSPRSCATASGALQTYGIAPLYVEDPQDMTQAEGDEQYNPRFMLNVLIQANRVEYVEMDTFTDAEFSVHPLA